MEEKDNVKDTVEETVEEKEEKVEGEVVNENAEPKTDVKKEKKNKLKEKLEVQEAINKELKDKIEHLIAKYDEALNWNDPAGDLLWGETQIQEFMIAAIKVYQMLCDELSADYEIEFYEHIFRQLPVCLSLLKNNYSPAEPPIV